MRKKIYKKTILSILLISIIIVAGCTVIIFLTEPPKDSKNGDNGNSDEVIPYFHPTLEQYKIFADSVRDEYMSSYLTGGYIGYAEFCRDIILHDSGQYDSFGDVSDVPFNWTNSMKAADFLMDNMVPNWDGNGLTGDELTDIDTIINWCIDKIDYVWDDEYNDYPRFSIETVDEWGDCEDQAILATTYLESCGFDTIMVVIHDPNYPDGGLYHGVCMVQISNKWDFWELYPNTPLLYFGASVERWSFIDTTWDVDFGDIPGWLDYFPLDMSFAFCDIEGVIISNGTELIEVYEKVDDDYKPSKEILLEDLHLLFIIIGIVNLIIYFKKFKF